MKGPRKLFTFFDYPSNKILQSIELEVSVAFYEVPNTDLFFWNFGFLTNLTNPELAWPNLIQLNVINLTKINLTYHVQGLKLS